MIHPILYICDGSTKYGILGAGVVRIEPNGKKETFSFSTSKKQEKQEHESYAIYQALEVAESKGDRSVHIISDMEGLVTSLSKKRTFDAKGRKLEEKIHQLQKKGVFLAFSLLDKQHKPHHEAHVMAHHLSRSYLQGNTTMDIAQIKGFVPSFPFQTTLVFSKKGKQWGVYLNGQGRWRYVTASFLQTAYDAVVSRLQKIPETDLAIPQESWHSLVLMDQQMPPHDKRRELLKPLLSLIQKGRIYPLKTGKKT